MAYRGAHARHPTRSTRRAAVRRFDRHRSLLRARVRLDGTRCDCLCERGRSSCAGRCLSRTDERRQRVWRTCLWQRALAHAVVASVRRDARNHGRGPIASRGTMVATRLRGPMYLRRRGDGTCAHHSIDDRGENRATRANDRGIYLVVERASRRRRTRYGAGRSSGRDLAFASLVRCGGRRGVARGDRRSLAVAPLGGEFLVKLPSPRVERFGEMLAQLLEKLVMRLELIAPCRLIDAGQLRVLRG